MRNFFGQMSLPSKVVKISKLLAPKGAIYRQGFCQKCQPNGQKGAISEKEIAIFKLRKVLFLDKHLRELPRAWQKQLHCKLLPWLGKQTDHHAW